MTIVAELDFFLGDGAVNSGFRIAGEGAGAASDAPAGAGVLVRMGGGLSAEGENGSEGGPGSCGFGGAAFGMSSPLPVKAASSGLVSPTFVGPEFCQALVCPSSSSSS